MKTKKLAKLKKRVNRGMELLDKENPEWDQKINLQTLNTSTLLSCVLGQLYGNYVEGCRQLNLNSGITQGGTEPAKKYGYSGGMYCGPKVHKKLTEIWTEKILERRKS